MSTRALLIEGLLEFHSGGRLVVVVAEGRSIGIRLKHFPGRAEWRLYRALRPILRRSGSRWHGTLEVFWRQRRILRYDFQKDRWRVTWP